MKKILYSILVLGVAGIGFLISGQLSRSNHDGTLTIVLIDEDGETVIDEAIPFDEGDSMIDILEEQYSIQCGDSSYNPTTCSDLPSFGRVLLTFEEVETDWWTTFLAIYIDDVYSVSGIDDIEPTDGTVYRFEFTEVGDAQ